MRILRQITGKLTYIKGRGRLDVDFVAAKVAKLTEHPHSKVFEWSERIITYSEQYKDVKLVQRENEQKLLILTMVSDTSAATEYDSKARNAGTHLVW